MDICSSFLNNNTINSINNTPLTKEQQIEFIKLCGFGRDKDIDINTINIACKDILNNTQDKCITTQIQGSLENIKLWIVSQINYFRQIDESNKSILSFYEKSGMFEWNNVLRGLIDPCSDIKNELNKEKTPTRFKEEFETFNQIILKAPQSPNMIVYRGETYDDLDTFNIPYSRDGKIYNKGFLSTTLDRNEAIKYALYKSVNGKQEINTNKKVLYQIEIPSGTPALFMGIRNYPNIDIRVEIVLPPNILRYIKDEGVLQYTSSSGNSSINVKRFKVEAILPLNVIIKGIANTFTEDILINEFFQRLKADNIIWEVNGVYGLNLLLKHRYKMQNLIPSNTLYLKGHYYKTKGNKDYPYTNDMNNKLYLITNEISKKYNILEDKFKINIERSNYLLYVIKFEACPNVYEDVIKIEYVEDYTYETVVDNELYKKLNLPIKTALGYSIEIQEILDNKKVHSDLNKKDKPQLEKMLNILKTLK